MDEKKCKYCGNEAKFLTGSPRSKVKNTPCCSQFITQCPALKKKNASGVKEAHARGEIPSFGGHRNAIKIWNKGLTIKTDPRVAKIHEIRRKQRESIDYINPLRNRKLSIEHKKKISISRSLVMQSNESHCRWFSVKCGNGFQKVQGTWERDFANFLNENNVSWERRTLEYGTHYRYTPDFYLPNFNMYVEIKGWLKDRDIKKMNLVLKKYNIDLRIIHGLNEFKSVLSKKKLLSDLIKYVDVTQMA